MQKALWTLSYRNPEPFLTWISCTFYPLLLLLLLFSEKEVKNTKGQGNLR